MSMLSSFVMPSTWACRTASDAEGDRRHDGQLVRGVDALDVEGRVASA